MAQQQQSREFDISDLSSIPLLGKRKEFDTISGPRLYTSQIEASTSPPPPLWAYPGHLTPFLDREGGNLITTHKGWGIWSLASMSCYESRWFHWVDKSWRTDGADVKFWWIQRKRLHICGELVENQRSTQAVFHIWRCFKNDLCL